MHIMNIKAIFIAKHSSHPCPCSPLSRAQAPQVQAPPAIQLPPLVIPAQAGIQGYLKKFYHDRTGFLPAQE